MMAVCVCVVFQKAKGNWFSWERWRRCGRARPHRPQGDHEQDNTKTRSKGTAVWGRRAVFRNPPTTEVCSSTSVQSTLHPVSPAQGKRSLWVIQMWNQIPRAAVAALWSSISKTADLKIDCSAAAPSSSFVLCGAVWGLDTEIQMCENAVCHSARLGPVWQQCFKKGDGERSEM